MKENVKRAYDELKSYAAVARIFNISRQRVHQIIREYGHTGIQGRKKKYQILFKEKCWICKKNEPKNLHHKDRNTKNDNVENLMPVCTSCHKLIHQYDLVELPRTHCRRCGRPFGQLRHAGKGFCSACYNFDMRHNRGISKNIYRKNKVSRQI